MEKAPVRMGCPSRSCRGAKKKCLALLSISPDRQGTPMLPEGSMRSTQTRIVSQELKAQPIMTVPNDIAGTAALAICESLLLALNDRNILPEREIVGVLKDAAAAHEFAPPGEKDALNAAVAALINNILAGGNLVRRR
jgi:hypothetical protein